MGLGHAVVGIFGDAREFALQLCVLLCEIADSLLGNTCALLTRLQHQLRLSVHGRRQQLLLKLNGPALLLDQCEPGLGQLGLRLLKLHLKLLEPVCHVQGLGLG